MVDDKARDYYEHEALRGGWSVRQLDRRSQPRLIIACGESAAALPSRAPPVIPILTNIFATLSFWSSWILKMNTRNRIWKRLSLGSWNAFCLSLGNDFTFVARQKRLRVGTEWYRVDLLFFHRRLRMLADRRFESWQVYSRGCGPDESISELCAATLEHPDENPPVGLILCSEKDVAVAHYSLGGLGKTVLAREYELVLPNQRRLAKKLESTRRILSAQTEKN